MRKISFFMVLFLSLVSTYSFAQTIKGDGVEFAGFGVDGDIKLDNPTFNIFQGIYVKNTTNTSKQIMVFYDLFGSLAASEIVTIRANSTVCVRLDIPPTPRLHRNNVTIKVLN